MQEKYGLKVKMATTANTLAKMVFTRGLEESEDLEFDCAGVISAATYGIRSIYHTTLKASPW